MSNTFGELVKRERKQKEISLAKLSQLMNDEINPSYINRLEKGEKENPGFRIVLGLCKALNLNMIEVYRSFGFESLASDESEQNNEFSIEDLFRLHNIVAPTPNVHEDLGLGQLNYIDHSEKEALISVISAIINYASEKEVNVDTLALILKQVEKVREVHQEVASKSEVITIEVDEINYTVELHHLLREGIEEFEEWKEGLKNELKKQGNKLRDYQSGIFSLTINEINYVLQKENTHIKVLQQKNKIIPL